MNEIEWNGEGLAPVDFLRSRLSYDATTGILTWLPRQESEFAAPHQYASWVSRFQGKAAGTEVQKKRKLYIRVVIGDTKIYAHRAAWAIHYGSHPDGEIDHLNGDSRDNRIQNLRVVSREENCRNIRLQSKTKSGYCGVNWHEETGKWRARVKVRGREKYIGLFDDIEEAAARIKELRLSLGFHEDHGDQRVANQCAEVKP